MSDAQPTKRVLKRPPKAPLEEALGPYGRPLTNGDDDDDETTPAPKMDGGQPPARRLKKGWTAGQETMESTSSYAQAFRPTEQSQVIKFLEDLPYASFRRHWVEGRSEAGGTTNRAYTCLQSYGDQCPLCEVGDKPQAVSAFNIALIGDDGQVLRKSWDVGVRLFNVLKSYSNDPKIAPLSKNFFIVSKTGKSYSVQYNISPVRATSLEEDYDIKPPDPDDLARLEPYDDTIITVESPRKLRELAQEITEEYD